MKKNTCLICEPYSQNNETTARRNIACLSYAPGSCGLGVSSDETNLCSVHAKKCRGTCGTRPCPRSALENDIFCEEHKTSSHTNKYHDAE